MLKGGNLPSSYPTHVLREIRTLIYGHYLHAPVEDLNDKLTELVLCMFMLCINAINVINIKNTVQFHMQISCVFSFCKFAQQHMM